MSLHPYIYRPLPDSNSIRLAELLPVSHGHDIQINLHGTTLEDAPAYQTLSYEWGEIVGSLPIRANDSQLLVTPNLLAALKRLRYPTLRRYLWIDAICINQGDDIEKTQQVGIMGKIYEQGHKVLMWIGEPIIPSTGLAIEAMRILEENFNIGVANFRGAVASQNQDLSGELLPLDLTKPDRVQPDLQDATLWQGLDDLYTRPYFSRLWIVQEVVLSPRAIIVCGAHTLSWETFYHCALYFQLTKEADRLSDLNIFVLVLQMFKLKDHLPLACVNTLSRSNLSSPRPMSPTSNGVLPHLQRFGPDDTESLRSMSSILLNFLDSKCRDPRDRIFALRSLMNKATQDAFKADYSLDVRQVYRTVVEIASQQRVVMRLLANFAPPSLSHIPSTPSWVPDFSCPRFATPENLILKDVSRSIQNDFLVDGDCLLLSGRQVATISHVSDLMSPAEIYSCLPATDLMTPEILSKQNGCCPSMNEWTLVSFNEQKPRIGEPLDGHKTQSTVEPCSGCSSFSAVLSSEFGQHALDANGVKNNDSRVQLKRPMLGPVEDKITCDKDLWNTWYTTWKLINGTRGSVTKDQLKFWQWDSEEAGSHKIAILLQLRAYQHRNQALKQGSSKLFIHKHGRQLFQSKSGVVGLGPPGIDALLPGDIVVQVDGDHWTRYALRPQGDGTFKFRGLVTMEFDPVCHGVNWPMWYEGETPSSRVFRIS